MPARSNPFQKLILQIHQQVAEPGVKVEESALLPEPSSGSLREVDVLLTMEKAGKVVRIAIECRDHGRTNDSTWVDSLIGNHIDLGVQKVVAVSSGKFSKMAQAKAKAHGIELLTLREALDTDWTDPFVKFGMVQIEHYLTPLSFSISTEPSQFGDIQPDTPIYDADANQVMVGTDLCKSLIQNRRNDLVRITSERMISEGKTPADIPNVAYEHEISDGIGAPIFVRNDGASLRIIKATVRVRTTLSYQIAEVTHQTLGDMRISDASMLNDAGELLDIRMIQEASKPGQTNVRIVSKG